jgi:hypothetical protein
MGVTISDAPLGQERMRTAFTGVAFRQNVELRRG